MPKFIQALPGWAEFLIVTAVGLGPFIVMSAMTVLNGQVLTRPHHNNLSLLLLVVFEAVLMAVLVPFLNVRGWTLRRAGLALSLHDTGTGAGLALLNYILYVAIWIAFATAFPYAAHSAAQVVVVSPGLALATALLVSCFNAVFEEVFVAGYVITALKEKHSLWFAINVSVALRLSYHLYQGVQGVIVSIPFGLLLGYWYARNGRLWPLIVAHALVDLAGTLTMVRF
jgi:membrane protease YdiL (CAAX protease family)